MNIGIEIEVDREDCSSPMNINKFLEIKNNVYCIGDIEYYNDIVEYTYVFNLTNKSLNVIKDDIKIRGISYKGLTQKNHLIGTHIHYFNQTTYINLNKLEEKSKIILSAKAYIESMNFFYNNLEISNSSLLRLIRGHHIVSRFNEMPFLNVFNFEIKKMDSHMYNNLLKLNEVNSIFYKIENRNNFLILSPSRKTGKKYSIEIRGVPNELWRHSNKLIIRYIQYM